MTSNVKFKIQWLYWNDWVHVETHTTKEAAETALRRQRRLWPFHEFRMVWERQRSAA
jgi:hypothetical protein